MNRKSIQRRQIPFRPDPRVAELIAVASKAAGVSVNMFLERLADRYHEEIIAEFEAEREKERSASIAKLRSLQHHHGT